MNNSNNGKEIGEHSDLLAEHDRWIDAYANAKDKLETLKELYSNSVTIK